MYIKVNYDKVHKILLILQLTEKLTDLRYTTTTSVSWPPCKYSEGVTYECEVPSDTTLPKDIATLEESITENLNANFSAYLDLVASNETALSSLTGIEADEAKTAAASYVNLTRTGPLSGVNFDFEGVEFVIPTTG